MTKKTFLLSCLLGMFASGTRAYQNTSEFVSVLTMEEGEKLPLRIKTKNNGNGEPPKRFLIPEIILRGNTLHFITPCNGCTFRLEQNDNTCYEVEITGNTLTIPTSFTGMYELQIVSGEYIFWCEIEL